jgi:hypothetical protein
VDGGRCAGLLTHRPETGDGRQAKGGEDLFLNCYLNFHFFEEQMRMEEWKGGRLEDQSVGTWNRLNVECRTGDGRPGTGEELFSVQ